MITLMCATGIRRGETIRLNVEDLDLIKRFLQVRNSTDADVRLNRTKSGEERTVPWKKEYLEQFEAYKSWRAEQDVPTKALFYYNYEGIYRIY